jgi:hypothetical protein
MTREQTAELVNAFNDGITGRYVSPVLTKIRAAWLEADEKERAIFKNEILSTEAGSLKEWPSLKAGLS